MQRMGSDWLYIGLGLGAVYLIFKAEPKISTVLGDVSDLTTSTVQATKPAFGVVNNILSGVENVTRSQFKPVSLLDWLTFGAWK